MIPVATLQDTGAGLVPATPGWFVVNARDARWIEQPGRGHSLPRTGVDEREAETPFHCPDEAAARHGAASPEETQDGAVAYARFPPSRPVRYHDGPLPE